MSCSSSIWCRDSNPRPLKHESSPITTIPVVNLIKHFTIVIYDSRVVGLENCPYYDSRVIIYARKTFIRLTTGLPPKLSVLFIPERNYFVNKAKNVKE